VGDAAVAEQAQSQNAEAAAMMKRLAVLEERLRNGVAVAATPQQAAAPQMQVKEYDPELKKLSECNDGPIKEWNDIVDNIRERTPAVGSFLKGSVAFIKGKDLFLIVQSDIYLKKFKASQDFCRPPTVRRSLYCNADSIQIPPENSDDPVAEADGHLVKMQHADPEEQAYADVRSEPGDPDLSAYIQADRFGHDLRYRFPGRACDGAFLRVRFTDQAFALGGNDRPLDYFSDRRDVLSSKIYARGGNIFLPVFCAQLFFFFPILRQRHSDGRFYHFTAV
jgi:hypothetical protein